jgi:hypothetical protein
MSEKLYTKQEAIAYIESGKRKDESKDEYAARLGISGVLLRRILQGRDNPGKKLGWEKVAESIRFRKIPPKKVAA